MSRKKLKVVVVGDGAVGKTCMLSTYSTGKFPKEYVPTVFDNFECRMEYNNEIYFLSLWDTAGQEDFDRLRNICYPDVDIFLVVFSISSPTSLENCIEKWIPEIEEHAKKDGPVVKILVGTKLDLRDDQQTLKDLSQVDERPVTNEDGLEVSKDESHGFLGYVECSALLGTNLNDVFDTAVEAFVEKGHRDHKIGVKGANGQKNCCLIL